MIPEQRDKESTICYKSFVGHLTLWVHNLSSSRTIANKTEIRNILDVCALKALEANSKTTTDISIRAESGNHLMLCLTQKARKDARTLKTITILSLIYLPASFVAVGVLSPSFFMAESRMYVPLLTTTFECLRLF